MTTLNVILDDMLSEAPSGPARYTHELASALIDHAPPGCYVAGFVGAATEPMYQLLADDLPGLSGLFKSALVRRDLTRAWQHGFTPVPAGMMHAPTLFAPLRRHDRVNDRSKQVVVTVHDAAAWEHPDYLSPRELAWTKAMAARAERYADAVVVPTHSVAAQLDGILALGDRMRVVESAVSARLTRPSDFAERVERLSLPDRFILTVGDSAARHGIEYLLSALHGAEGITLPLVVVGEEREADGLSRRVIASGLDPDRVVALGALGDEDYSTVLSSATLLVYPGLSNGFATPVLEAFKFGVPVVHSATSSLVEIVGDAGLAVDASDLDAYPGLLAEAIETVLEDEKLNETLTVLGQDREKLFTWRAAAESIWQLHADL